MSNYKSIYDIELSNERQRLEILGCLGNSSETRLVTFLNPYSIQKFESKENLELIYHFDYIFSDGTLLVKFYNIYRKNKIIPVSFDFSSFAVDVFELCDRNSLKMALVGGSEEEAERSIERLAARFENIQFVYYRNGFFSSSDDSNECIKKISLARPDVVVCGMGTPLQEKFLLELSKHTDNPFLGFTCGAFLTQTAYRDSYYPGYIKNLGLRWLYRAMKEPHVRQRLLIDYPRFVFKYVSHMWSER
ncbi:WecB/TagA/CpsF family glycosyltransferase [Saccharospirillum salsuginis]|uniref:Teichoic acid biosynthesis protein A n=1 Tax=Saccharospirillum salsuginis TaxID=418750 RepID=A0A918KG89_9GAMM|nr:WecB/TagA/CpsF family glycosyltransferase [Saccharospirillum salsuginis]GGX60361.1 teichoic acid biosynthesis protein A [Saccharospirillum salsuginis]